MHLLTMILLPVGAIRAVDKLSRDALCEFSSVAVVSLLCGNDMAVSLLRRYAIDVSQLSVAADTTLTDSDPSRCAQWYRRLLADEVAQLSRL